MPGLNGIEATRRIVADSPHTAVVVLTMFDDDNCFAAHARRRPRLLLKGAGQEQIRRAVRSAAAGEAIFGAELATRVQAYFAQAPPGPGTLTTPGLQPPIVAFPGPGHAQRPGTGTGHPGRPGPH